MKFRIKVIPGKRKEGVRRLSDGRLCLQVSAPAVRGKANDAVVNLLAQTFDLPKSSVIIIKGATGRFKEIEAPITLKQINSLSDEFSQ